MPCRIVILGAGISGLSCAWYLKKKFGPRVQVTIVEKSHRVGGWIQTVSQEGFLFELGPHSCRSKGAGLYTLQLIEALNLQSKVILSDPCARFRYRYINQKLQKLPHHLPSLLFSSFLLQMGRAVGKDFMAPKEKGGEESVESFFTRRFGREIAEQFADPLVSGIYAGDIRKLSLKACFPLLFQCEQKYGSVLKGLFYQRSKSPVLTSPFIQSVSKSPIFSFKEGLETLVKELQNQIEADIRLECEPISVEPLCEGIRLTLSDQSKQEADYVFSTLPAYALGDLLRPGQAHLSALLSQLPYASVVVVNLGYHRPVLTSKGFGYLIPSQEKESILGCVWDSCIFPQHNQHAEETRLTVMMGGTRYPEIAHYPLEKCISIALSALEKHLGIQEFPQTVYVKIAKQAIPQYEVGYEQLLNSISLHESLPRLKLLGNAFCGISLNDCIMQTKKMIEQLNLST